MYKQYLALRLSTHRLPLCGESRLNGISRSQAFLRRFNRTLMQSSSQQFQQQLSAGLFRLCHVLVYYSHALSNM